MKYTKHISALLALFILLLNSQLLIVSHFCHDNLASVRFTFEKTQNSFSEDMSCCSSENTDSSEEEDSCCKNHKIKLDKKVDLDLIKYFDFNFPLVEISFRTIEIKNFQKKLLQIFRTNYYYTSNSPPIYLKNCQFIFYA